MSLASPSRPRLLLLDGHSLAYRAYYAMAPLTTRRGEPIGAVLGFVNMVLKAIELEQPTHIAVSFDRVVPEHRLALHPGYKGQRDAMPEALASQLPVIEELVIAFGIPVYASMTHEADDCLGTLARRGAAAGFEPVIVSGDQDLLQLVDAHIRVLSTVRGVSDTVRYDEAAVQARYGFAPSLLPDYKALAGDPSDNIPGIAGIGKGTATRLVTELGSIEAMLAQPQAIPERWRARLVEQAELLRRFRQLATIETELDLGEQWEACRWTGVPASALPLLQRLEFAKVIERVGLGTASAPPPVAALSESAPPTLAVEVLAHEAAVAAALEGLADLDAVGIALCWRDDRTATSMAVALDERRVLVLPLAVTQESQLFAEAGLDARVAARFLADLVERAGASTLWWFDLKRALVELPLEGLVQRCPRALADVGVASYVLESGESQKSLQVIASRHERRWVGDYALGEGVDGEVSRLAQEAACVRDVGCHLARRLADAGLTQLFTDVDSPLVEVLADMERVGVALDVAYLQRLATVLARDLTQLHDDICLLAGRTFNLNSPKQLGEILFEVLAIPGGKKTKTGAYTTDADVLAALATDYPICDLLLRYRELSKIESTYVRALPRLVRPATGRIHSSWNATVAATGRLSSSEPNLQNIPVRTELGKSIRRAFTAGEPGQVLLCADYSQVELRIMAHLSQDAALLAAFRDGLDVHAATASQIFGVPLAEVTSEQRRKAKEINFGIMYGMGPEGLSQRIGVSRKEARVFIDGYLERFAGVARYMAETITQATERGYVETMLGRRRYLPDLQSRNRMLRAAAERMAINAPIQGTSADLIKRAMVTWHARAEAGVAGDLGPQAARLIMQVHDELVFEVRESRLVDVVPVVVACMRDAMQLDVPLQVDVELGTTWADLRTYVPPSS
jgi:DNA polymerase I